MEKISEMIKRMCPEGVDKVKLSSLCISISTGLNPRTNFKLNEDGAMLKYVTVKEIATNKIVFSDSTDKISDKAKVIINKRSRLEKGDILFSGIGTIGKVVYVDIETDNWDCSESVFLLKPNDFVCGKYLSYTLISKAVVSQYESCAAGAIMKGVRKGTLENLDIPLPPLPIQQETVRILDSFTSMITNLETELASRQKQYEYYRNKLLTFDENDESVEWKTLGEIVASDCSLSYGIVQPGDGITNGVPVVRPVDLVNTIVHNINLKNTTEEISNAYKRTILKGGELLLCVRGTTGVLSIAGDDLCGCNVTRGIVPLWFDERMSRAYVYHIIKSTRIQDEIERNTNGAGLRQINIKDLKAIKIPVPDMDCQCEFVSILDTFESLITNIKQEIAARKKQYEYYREQLLIFE